MVGNENDVRLAKRFAACVSMLDRLVFASEPGEVIIETDETEDCVGFVDYTRSCIPGEPIDYSIDGYVIYQDQITDALHSCLQRRYHWITELSGAYPKPKLFTPVELIWAHCFVSVRQRVQRTFDNVDLVLPETARMVPRCADAGLRYLRELLYWSFDPELVDHPKFDRDFLSEYFTHEWRYGRASRAHEIRNILLISSEGFLQREKRLAAT